jgi:hypothetical protein
MNRNQQVIFRPGVTNKVAYTGTAGVVTVGTASGTWAARVVCDSDAYIAIGAAPVATANDMPVFANLAVTLSLRPGEKVSAIQKTAAGTLFVTDLTD